MGPRLRCWRHLRWQSTHSGSWRLRADVAPWTHARHRRSRERDTAVALQLSTSAPVGQLGWPPFWSEVAPPTLSLPFWDRSGGPGRFNPPVGTIQRMGAFPTWLGVGL